MDLRYTAEEDEFRAEARTWLEANVPSEPLPSFDTEEGFALHRDWERTLAGGRWSAVSWPEEYGGRGADYIHWLIFEEEYYRAGAPGRVNQNGIFLLGPTLMDFGTAEQKSRFLPRMAAGDEVWAGDGDSTIKVIDLKSMKITDTIKTGGSTRVDEMAYDPKNMIFIGVNNAEEPPFATLVSMNPGHKVIAKVPFPDATDGAEQPDYNPADGMFYVAIPEVKKNEKKGGVAVIDAAGKVIVIG